MRRREGNNRHTRRTIEEWERANGIVRSRRSKSFGARRPVGGGGWDEQDGEQPPYISSTSPLAISQAGSNTPRRRDYRPTEEVLEEEYVSPAHRSAMSAHQSTHAVHRDTSSAGKRHQQRARSAPSGGRRQWNDYALTDDTVVAGAKRFMPSHNGSDSNFEKKGEESEKEPELCSCLISPALIWDGGPDRHAHSQLAIGLGAGPLSATFGAGGGTARRLIERREAINDIERREAINGALKALLAHADRAVEARTFAQREGPSNTTSTGPMVTPLVINGANAEDTGDATDIAASANEANAARTPAPPDGARSSAESIYQKLRNSARKTERVHLTRTSKLSDRAQFAKERKKKQILTTVLRRMQHVLLAKVFDCWFTLLLGGSTPLVLSAVKGRAEAMRRAGRIAGTAAALHSPNSSPRAGSPRAGSCISPSYHHPRSACRGGSSTASLSPRGGRQSPGSPSSLPLRDAVTPSSPSNEALLPAASAPLPSESEGVKATANDRWKKSVRKTTLANRMVRRKGTKPHAFGPGYRGSSSLSSEEEEQSEEGGVKQGEQRRRRSRKNQKKKATIAAELWPVAPMY